MDDRRTELYKGVRICAEALPEYEFWRSVFTLEQYLHRSESVALMPLYSTEESALTDALRTGERCVDSEGFLLADSIPALTAICKT